MNENELKELEEEKKKSERLRALLKLEPINYAELDAVFKKWLIIEDEGILRFITAFYIAHRLPGKALWAFVIGPSGGGKTEFLNALLGLGDTYPISMLTPQTLLSGMPSRNDSSLLLQINNKISIFKDWTSILSMQKDAKAEIYGQFREVYDGSMRKAFGNGAVRTWEGKVTILAATTQAVDLQQQASTHLGERFINYRIIMPDRKEAAMRALNNDYNHELMEKELQDAMFAFMKGINWELVKKPMELEEEYKKKVVTLANFCTMARSGIIRDMGMKKEVIFVPAAEMPTRITGQLAKLLQGLIILNGGVLDPKDLDVVYKVALDSIPHTNKMVITEMARADYQTTTQIATALGYPTEPIRIYLENLAMLKVCKRIKDGGQGYKWKMEPEFTEIIRHYEGIEQLSDEEVKKREADEQDDIFGDIETDVHIGGTDIFG